MAIGNLQDQIDSIGDSEQGPAGDDGADGTNCSTVDTDAGADITCGDATVSLFDGASGEQGPVGKQGPGSNPMINRVRT